MMSVIIVLCKVGKNVLHMDIRLKLMECINSRVELISRTDERIVGLIEWVSPDGQMAEIRMANGEIRTVCDTELSTVKSL